MIPAIYFMIFLAYAIWLLGILIKDIPITLLGCLILFALSVYTFANGIDIFPHNNLLVIMFSAVTFGLASYTSYLAISELL